MGREIDHYEFRKESERIFFDSSTYSDSEAEKITKDLEKLISASSYMDEAIYLYKIINSQKVDNSRYWIHHAIIHTENGYRKEKYNIDEEHDKAYNEALKRCRPNEIKNLKQYYEDNKGI